MSRLFEDFEPASAVWGRDTRSGLWHILGETLPRIAPVSPRVITPCGRAALYADGLKTSKSPPSDRRCHFCQTFLEQRQRDAYMARS